MRGKSVDGYVARARITYPYPLAAVLDATHDHNHLSQKDQDIKREDVIRAECVRSLCRINVQVLVGSFFPVGDVAYELCTEIHERKDGSILIEWNKRTGTRFIKHLHGRLRLIPVGTDGRKTAVDYALEVAAPRLSADKLGDKARAYLVRLGNILDERHEGHPSLWSAMHDLDAGGP